MEGPREHAEMGMMTLKNHDSVKENSVMSQGLC
jgi:hypothetical protein